MVDCTMRQPPAARQRTVPPKVKRPPYSPRCSCGYCAPLREIRRRLVAERKARGNEQALLAELVTSDPPEGGMAAYLADMERS